MWKSIWVALKGRTVACSANRLLKAFLGVERLGLRSLALSGLAGG
jgi:hypothetical protein